MRKEYLLLASLLVSCGKGLTEPTPVPGAAQNEGARLLIVATSPAEPVQEELAGCQVLNVTQRRFLPRTNIAVLEAHPIEDVGYLTATFTFEDGIDQEWPLMTGRLQEYELRRLECGDPVTVRVDVEGEYEGEVYSCGGSITTDIPCPTECACDGREPIIRQYWHQFAISSRDPFSFNGEDYPAGDITLYTDAPDFNEVIEVKFRSYAECDPSITCYERTFYVEGAVR